MWWEELCRWLYPFGWRAWGFITLWVWWSVCGWREVTCPFRDELLKIWLREGSFQTLYRRLFLLISSFIWTNCFEMHVQSTPGEETHWNVYRSLTGVLRKQHSWEKGDKKCHVATISKENCTLWHELNLQRQKPCPAKWQDNMGENKINE